MSTVPSDSYFDVKAREWSRRLLFPAFNEAQYFLAVVILVTIFAITPDYMHVFIRELEHFMTFLYFSAFVALTIAILLKRRLSAEIKIFACLVYYGFFAAGAGMALQILLKEDHVSAFDQVNTWLTGGLLALSVTRGVATLLAIRTGDTKMIKLIAKSLQDVQYTKTGFAVCAVLALNGVLLMQNFYQEPLAIAILAYTYSSGILFVLELLLGAHLRYPVK